MGDFEGAESHGRAALAAMELHLHKHHPAIVTVVGHLAQALQKQKHASSKAAQKKRQSEAVRLRLRAAVIMQVIYGKEHPYTKKALAAVDAAR